MPMPRLKKLLRRFQTDQSGAVSLEYALWVSFMTGVLCLSADVTVLMHEKTLLFDAARDAARQVASGQKTNDEAAQMLAARLGAESQYSVNIVSSDGFVTATIGVPFSDVTIFGDGFTGDAQLSSQVVMWIES